MARDLPASLATAVAAGTHRLSTILEIKRRDDVFVRLTDASGDITADAKVFQSKGGYQRSAIAFRDGFEVDDMEIEGLLDASAITEADIRDRLYAGAPFTMWVVDRSGPTNARAVLLRGNVGRIRPEAGGHYKAELRGLKNRFRQGVVQTYGFECSAQLGDDRCGVPLNPPEVQRDAAYFEGEFVRVATHASAATRHAVPILNPSFETTTAGNDGIPDDWTVLRGSPSRRNGASPLSPAHGTWILTASTSASLDNGDFACEQTVSISGLGLADAVIDVGDGRMSFSIRRGTGGEENRDLGRVLVEALDAAGDSLGAIYDSGFEWIPLVAEWVLRGVTAAKIPALARSIRIDLDGRLRTGTQNEAAFDNLVAVIWDGSGGLGQEQWENRIYECTTAGTTAAAAPTYSTTIGATTTDGGAVFTARESWMKHAEITAVTDNKEFTISVTDSRAVDDWFNRGVVHWESGANAGLGMEIKDWDSGTSTVTLFLGMNRTVAVGDRIRIFPGCGRHLAHCRDKFDNVLNYRGFPHIPGSDFMQTFPGVR